MKKIIEKVVNYWKGKDIINNYEAALTAASQEQNPSNEIG